MSKSPKRSGKSGKESKSKKVKANSQGEANSRGKLIALEGTRGKDLIESVQRLSRQFGKDEDGAGWSRWDASNTFYEMRMGKPRNLAPPPRTLLLLYASDLMFRLRWEIEPALNEGRTVLAAPYVQSAMAVGAAIGLSKDWLTELFSFAPKPDACLRLKEKAKLKDKSKKNKDKKQAKVEHGFVEFCCSTLAATSPDWDPVQVRGAVLKYFDDLEKKDEIVTVGKKLPKGLAK